MSTFPPDWPDVAWAKLTAEQQQRAADIIRSVENFEEIAPVVREAHAKHGRDFIHQEPFAEEVMIEVDGQEHEMRWSWHMSGGMALRNLLRDKGFRDDELPGLPEFYDGADISTWDDFYVQALEAAVGVR